MDIKKRKLEENGEGAAAPAGSSMAPLSAAGLAGTAVVAPSSAPGIAMPVELSRDDAHIMIDPLPREDLLELVIDATLRHYDVLEEVRKFADKDPVHRKIFVRGLGWETNTDSLKGVFSQFGELEEGIVIMDKNTGKSRGYGFITFKHMDGVLNALKEPSKRIDGRMTVCQLASTGPSTAQPPQDIAARKIYVGNVPMEWPADRLLNLFAQYGEIEEGPLGFDKQTGRSRGFALFIYKTADAAKRSLEEPVKLLDGHQLFCKLAAEGLKQKVGALQGQSEIYELPMAQSAGATHVHPNIQQYGAAPQGMMSTGASYNQNTNPPSMNLGVSPAMNPPMNPTVHSSLPMPNQSHLGANPSPYNTSLSSSVNPSHAQVMSTGVSQVQTSSGLPSYGAQAAMGSYAPQLAGYGAQSGSYGAQPGAYIGVAAPVTSYSATPGSVGSQIPVLQGQGQYTMPSYQNQQQVAATSAPRAQQTGVVPSMPYYGM